MLTGGCLPAQAETSWPTKPVRFIVPLAAGGALDFAARQVSAILTYNLAQQVFVENRTGAGGTIGMHGRCDEGDAKRHYFPFRQR